VEGPTEDESIVAARAQTSRNIMATLMLSLGVPMITAGDELGRSQRGNNNAYCQDNELTWLDWSMDTGAQEMLAATQRLIQVRRNFLANQPSSYPARGESSYLHWYNAEGRPMTPEQWRDPASRVLQLLIGSPDGLLDGLVVFNASAARVDITLPVVAADGGPARRFELRMTTAREHDERKGKVLTKDRDRVAANSINIYRS
jgi:glycogen operon protein